MELILEKLDNEIFNEEMKSELLESFDSMIDVKSSEKALEMVEAKQADYDSYINEEITKYKSDLTEKLDAYLDTVVDEFITENKIAIDSEVKTAQMDAVMEGFNSLLVATGIELVTISKAKESEEAELAESIETELAEAHTSNDSLVEQVMKLKAQNEELLKTGLIQEEMLGLTVVQKEKFVKLAETLEFDIKNPTKFMAQLDAIKSTVSDVKVTEAKIEIDETPETIVTEAKVEKVEKQEKVIVEKQEKVALYKSSARHLY